jgi:DNA polymerase I
MSPVKSPPSRPRSPNDARLWEAYQSGDVYLAFAKQAGLSPPDATRETFGAGRDMCNALSLGIAYGMTA